ncbi:hypothetical protein [Microbacterium arborescens]
MTGTTRAIAVPGRPVVEAQESKRWRGERNERRAKRQRAEKRAERADRYADRRYRDEDEG